MTYKDFLLGPLYFFIVLFIANLFKKRLAKTELEQEFYTKALVFKLFAVTFFAFIYEFYYRGGDTIGFYAWSAKYINFLFNDTSSALEFLFTNSKDAFYKFKYNHYANSYGYIMKYNSREASFIKISSVVNILAMGSYLSTSYLFALFSFFGNWLLYKVFINYFPTIKTRLAWATLFVPSVAFWGTGILKDTITFGALGFLIYAIFKIFIHKNKIIRNIFILTFSIYLIMLLKAYIFLAFLPAGVMWIFNEQKEKIKSSALKTILTPFFIVMIIATLGGLFVMIGDSAGRFSISHLEQTTKDFQGWHKVASENGSGYVIHSTGTSAMSLLKAFPESIIVTYFRPFLWESGNIVVLMGAIESLFFLLFFLKVFLYKGKIFFFFRAIFSKPILQMSFIFILLFGFVVGFTSFNFGALARYKIPSMPIFSALLVMLSFQIDVLRGKL